MQNRCAQEILDGLSDHTTAFEDCHSRLQGRGGRYSIVSSKLAVAVNAASHASSSHETGDLLSDELTVAMEHLDNEHSDRASLAIAKVLASGEVGDETMSVGKMEHLRKALPVYIRFLRAYLEAIERGERELAAHVAATEEKGTQMARDALASLGTSKGASDAHAFVKSISTGHVRDTQFKFIVHRDGKSRATKEMERVEDLIGFLDSAKTNANSAACEPFGNVEPTPDAPVDVSGGRKTVQEILCASTSGPASLYSKMEKITRGLAISSESGSTGRYIVAGIEGPGLCRVELYRHDILQRFKDWFDLLIRYKTAMDRFNLEVKFVGGDGKTYTIQEELIRHEQSSRLTPFITTCMEQVTSARSNVERNNSSIVDRESRLLTDLQKKHKHENVEALNARRKTTRGRTSVVLPEDEATTAAKVSLERAEDQARAAKHQNETANLHKETDQYRKDNFLTLVVFPGIEDRLKTIQKDIDANQKVNRRRRSPANAQKWVACQDI